MLEQTLCMFSAHDATESQQLSLTVWAVKPLYIQHCCANHSQKQTLHVIAQPPCNSPKRSQRAEWHHYVHCQIKHTFSSGCPAHPCALPVWGCAKGAAKQACGKTVVKTPKNGQRQALNQKPAARLPRKDSHFLDQGHLRFQILCAGCL